MEASPWYTINNVDELDTPALVVYPQRVQYNINLIKTMIDDVVRLRPHVKTHKSLDVSLLMVQAGISKFKCATIAEAEMLGMAKASDVLLAYQPTGPKLNRFIALIKAYPKTIYSCLIDNEASALELSSKAIEHNIVLPVYIDLNVGMNRTGIAPDNALTLYETASKLSGLNVLGLHAYDGHIHDNDYEIRKKLSDESIAPVLRLADNLLGIGYPYPVIIAGGSPTFPIMAKKQNLECSPGTFVYWDRGYQLAYAEQPFLTAALLVARVVSLPQAGKICIDLGHKSVSAENELGKRVYFLNAPELKFVGHSEEHLIADAGLNHQYKIGDVLYGLPYHVCPSVGLYERAVIVEDKLIKGEWKTIARDRKLTI